MRPLALDSSAVAVLAQPAGDCAPQLRVIEAWARERDLELLDLGTTDAPRALDGGCAFVVALGGDGTILRALQLAMLSHSPVLGVNFGHVGFLADIEGRELTAALDRIGRGEAQVDDRTALVATTQTDERRHMVAFNDVVISRLAGHGTARLHVEVSGEPVLDVTGDGLVVASPTGSTAYNMDGRRRAAAARAACQHGLLGEESVDERARGRLRGIAAPELDGHARDRDTASRPARRRPTRSGRAVRARRGRG